ncbi:MAG TPA: hypothetical protein VMU56_08870, partial [Beijerinckiaceae bacterium]|nr:hypothetical protein [Beijerinckiaceae bacterium]
TGSSKLGDSATPPERDAFRWTRDSLGSVFFSTHDFCPKSLQLFGVMLFVSTHDFYPKSLQLFGIMVFVSTHDFCPKSLQLFGIML